VIYGAYGAALGLLILIVLFLLISAFFRRHRRGGPRPPGPVEPLIDPAAADTRELEPVDRAVARSPGDRAGPGHVGSRAAIGLAALLFVVVLGAAYRPGRARRAA
jgi:hypothetical protein